MTNPIIIPAQEHGIVRLFALSYKTAMEMTHGETLAPLADALGAPALDPDHVQIVALRQLGDLGLTGLLEDGHGIAPATLAPDRVRLNTLTGDIAILRSRAFGGVALTLSPQTDCTLIAAYPEEGAPPPRLDPLISPSAEGTLGDGPPVDEMGHRASRRTLLVAVAAAALVALTLLALGPGR